MPIELVEHVFVALLKMAAALHDEPITPNGTKMAFASAGCHSYSLGSVAAHEETEVAVTRLAHRPGELGRAAVRLGEKRINIDYSYCGLEPGSKRALVVFGVDNFNSAVNALDKLAGGNA